TDKGVYIGNGWILTAGHVGPGTATFSNGQSFAYDPGTFVYLHNPPGFEDTADLAMFHLVGTPSASSLPIASTTPAVADKLTLIGYGSAIIPGTGETHWTRAPDPDHPGHYIYTETDQATGTYTAMSRTRA